MCVNNVRLAYTIVIICKPNVNFCTMSIWVSIHIYFSSILLFMYFFVYLINYILLCIHVYMYV